MAWSYEPASRYLFPRRKKPSASSGSGWSAGGINGFSFMFVGYNTNGFAHHRLEDALAVLANLGYEGVALTLDHHALNPFDPQSVDQARVVRDLLRTNRLRAVVETGARFLLDARRKHQPTLLDPDPVLRERRRDFIRRAAVLAEALGVSVVSFWSGTPVDDAPTAVLMERLTESCAILAQDVE